VTRSGSYATTTTGACCGHRGHKRLENLEFLDLASNKLEGLTVLRSTPNFTASSSVSRKHVNSERCAVKIRSKDLDYHFVVLMIYYNRLSFIYPILKH